MFNLNFLHCRLPVSQFHEHQRDGLGETARTAAARIQEQNRSFAILFILVRMSENDDVGINAARNVALLVCHKEAISFKLKCELHRQIFRPRAVVVAADDFDRGNLTEFVQNLRLCDIPRVKNEIAALQGFENFGAEHVVGVRKDSYFHGGHLATSGST